MNNLLVSDRALRGEQFAALQRAQGHKTGRMNRHTNCMTQADERLFLGLGNCIGRWRLRPVHDRPGRHQFLDAQLLGRSDLVGAYSDLAGVL